ncbi:Guanylate kinase [Candidatus Liberibacter asiaticus]|nr:Guanylate kinase [Candidatus Liberibacter asiaticus]
MRIIHGTPWGINMAHIFVLIGASGVGKTTLARSVIKAVDKLIMPVGVTTRLPRKDEQNGIDYRFLSHKKFQQWIQEGKFIETAFCRNKQYGLLKEDILNPLENGFDLLTILTNEGLKEFEKLFDQQIVSLFIAPPSKQVLEQRRRQRGNWKVITEEDDIFGRNRAYDFTIINDHLGIACQQICRIREFVKQQRIIKI